MEGPAPVGVVLAAGAGTRLRPLTRLRPKPLCPVAGVPLIDHALRRVREVTTAVAVNLHHGRERIDEHLPADVHRSYEEAEALGTAGALGHLRDWIAARPVLVVNADTWAPGSLAGLVDGWDGERVRLLLADEGDGAPRLRATSGVAGALMPWWAIEALPDEPAGLYATSWRPAEAAGALEVIGYEGPFVDCGTPAQYLAANLTASDGQNVIEPGARVEGSVERCVVWADAWVHPAESISSAIVAAEDLVVLVR